MYFNLHTSSKHIKSNIPTMIVAVGSLWWRAGRGAGVRGRRIGCDGGWTVFVGPTLASPRGRIGSVMCRLIGPRALGDLGRCWWRLSDLIFLCLYFALFGGT